MKWNRLHLQSLSPVLFALAFALTSGCLPTDQEYYISGAISPPAGFDATADHWVLLQGYDTQAASDQGIAPGAEAWPADLAIAEAETLPESGSMQYEISGMQASCNSAGLTNIKQLVMWIDVGRHSSTDTGSEQEAWPYRARPEAGDWISVYSGALDFDDACRVPGIDFLQWEQVVESR